MNLARKAFEVATTSHGNAYPSLLQAAFADRDWETVMSILCLSPSKLDALIALSTKGGESILRSLKGTLDLDGRDENFNIATNSNDSQRCWTNEPRKHKLGPAGRRPGDQKGTTHTDDVGVRSDATMDADYETACPDLPPLRHFQEQDPPAIIGAARVLASRNSSQETFTKIFANEADKTPISYEDVRLGCCVMGYLAEARDILSCNSVIHIAARNGQVYHVERLLTLGADIEEISTNPQDKKATPLLTASASNDVEVLEFFLSRGANVDATNADGMNVLHVAAINGRSGNAELLVSRGLDIEARTADGQTALHVAAEAGSVQVLRTLWSLGADIEARDSSRETPIFSAIKGKRPDAVEYLLRSQCNVQAKARFGETPMHVASEVGHQGIIALLIQYNANTGAKNRAGKTPLMVAASQKGNSTTVKCLLANGCSVHDTDAFGRAALHVASDGEIARILVQHGAHQSAKDLNQQTPLSTAIFSRNTETAKFLIDAGSNLDCRDVFGNSALHYAVGECLVGLSAHLIQYGATIEVQNGSGETPVDIAVRCDCTSLIQLFTGPCF